MKLSLAGWIRNKLGTGKAELDRPMKVFILEATSSVKRDDVIPEINIELKGIDISTLKELDELSMEMEQSYDHEMCQQRLRTLPELSLATQLAQAIYKGDVALVPKVE